MRHSTKRIQPGPEGTIWCGSCQQYLPNDRFPASYHGKVHGRCRECRQTAKDGWREAFSWDFTPERLERFWGYVAAPDANGCRLWTSYKNSYGYGQFYIDGRQLGAHRVALKLAGIEPPKWPVVVDHICRNRACVEVAHMRIVTQRINTVENSKSPHARNAVKPTCLQGHPFNAWIETKHPKTGKPGKTRVCLICNPHLRLAAERFKAKHGDIPVRPHIPQIPSPGL